MHIDLWTLGLQAINAIVLIWLLARFLFRPVTAIIAARRQAADTLLAEAAAEREKAQAEATELAKQRAAISSEADRLLADAHSAAEAERTRLREQGAREAADARSEAQTAIARERDAMQHGLDARAGELAIDDRTPLVAAIARGCDHHRDAAHAGGEDRGDAGGGANSSRLARCHGADRHRRVA